MLRLRPLLRFVAPMLLGLCSMGSVACNRVRVDDVRGPDHTDWKRISCRRMDKKCYRAAAQLCPNGYYLATTARPAPLPPEHAASSETASAPATAGYPRAPRPQAGVNARTLPPQEHWGEGMYSRSGGSILVQCAESIASR